MATEYNRVHYPALYAACRVALYQRYTPERSRQSLLLVELQSWSTMNLRSLSRPRLPGSSVDFNNCTHAVSRPSSMYIAYLCGRTHTGNVLINNKSIK